MIQRYDDIAIIIYIYINHFYIYKQFIYLIYNKKTLSINLIALI